MVNHHTTSRRTELPALRRREEEKEAREMFKPSTIVIWLTEVLSDDEGDIKAFCILEPETEYIGTATKRVEDVVWVSVLADMLCAR